MTVLEHKPVDLSPMNRFRSYDHEVRVWEETVLLYEAQPDSFYAAWHYVNDHPMFWHSQYEETDDHAPFITTHWGFGSTGVRTSLRPAGSAPAVTVDVVLTDRTGFIQQDEKRNTRTAVWLETGKISLFPVTEHGITYTAHWHDIELDCGASTYEAAVITLAGLIWDKYGNDRQVADFND